MKRIANILCSISVCILMIGCYELNDQDYKTLAKINIAYDQATIHSLNGEQLSIDLGATSENSKEMSYEWVYGAMAGSFPNMLDSMLISTHPNINHTFTKPGAYVLRLKIDNGESILLKYFELVVTTGFDEGILILSNDNSNNGSLTFIKKRTPQEEADNKREIWDDVMQAINPEHKIKSGSDLYLSFYTDRSALLIGTQDSEGTIYNLDPKTLELINVNKMANEYNGAKPTKFLGETRSSAAYSCIVLGSNNMIYQYDLGSDFVSQRADERYRPTFSTEGINGTSTSKRYPVMFNDSEAMIPASSGKTTVLAIEAGMKLVNVSMVRGTPVKFNFVTQGIADPLKIKTFNTSGTLTLVKAGASYTAKTPLAMDQNSIMVNTRVNQYAYYNYNDKLYRWDVSNLGATLSLPSETDFVRGPDNLSIIPVGEQICSICTINNTYINSTEPENLIVATYNPSRTGDKKGSIYIIDLNNHSILKKYEGVCDKPAKVLYKHLI